MNNKFIISNDENLRNGIKKWYCDFMNDPSDFVFFEFNNLGNGTKKMERFSANGFNNLLIVICALKEHIPIVRIYVQLFSNQVVEELYAEGESYLRDAVKRELIFLDSLNLIDMLIELGVVIRPSNETIKKIIEMLAAKKQKLQFNSYSSKILCLSPLVNNNEEQYNLTFRMKTLISILYRRLKIDYDIVKEASGQIMFELVKNIYQHSGIKNEKMINGFTCAQINPKPLIKLSNSEEEEKYSESVFLSLSQNNTNFMLDSENKGSFISITMNDFGVGIHNRVMEKRECSINEAILFAFTTDFSSKTFEIDDEYWEYNSGTQKVPLEHRGYGLLYCLLFIFNNLGRIKVCSGNSEVKLFAKIEKWAEDHSCKTPVDFLELLKKYGYKEYFSVECIKTNCENFVGTQILIEIPTDRINYRS